MSEKREEKREAREGADARGLPCARDAFGHNAHRTRKSLLLGLHLRDEGHAAFVASMKQVSVLPIALIY